MASLSSIHGKITRDQQRQFQRNVDDRYVWGRIPDGTKGPRNADSRQQRRREDLGTEKSIAAAQRHRRRVDKAIETDTKQRRSDHD